MLLVRQQRHRVGRLSSYPSSIRILCEEWDMQDRYAGDVGDFGKIGLLKCLQKHGFTIGVNWYRVRPLDNEMNEEGYNYSEEAANSLVRNYDKSIRDSFLNKEPVDSVALDIGYMCG